MADILLATDERPHNALPVSIPTTSAIFVISALGLFLEMLMIRWIGTEVRIFAYLQNSILIACFLGLGLGSLTSGKPVAFRHTLIPLTFLLGCLAIPFMRRGLAETTNYLGVLQDFVYWGGANSADLRTTAFALVVGLGITFGILRLTVDMFVPIGRMLGRLIDTHPNTISAYSVNIAGSLTGIWLFVVVGRNYQPPVIWIAILAILSIPFILGADRRWTTLSLLIGAIVLAVPAGRTPGSLEVAWSPYQ